MIVLPFFGRVYGKAEESRKVGKLPDKIAKVEESRKIG